MNFTPHFMEQRSPEWYAMRVGLLTGSAVGDVIAERKRGTGELKCRSDLRRRLVCERITGLSTEDAWQSEDMRRGSEVEPEAFASYEAQTGLAARRVGFLKHNTLQAGCSPDGYVGEWEGLLEIKCPRSTTHLEYLQAGILPEAYKGQCLHALWISGAQWIDFCSYDKRFPESLELFIVRLHRSDFDIAVYERTISAFLAEVDREVATLMAAAVAV